MKNIVLYSFFSGCGLLDLGMERAGFDIAVVSEKYNPFLYAYKYSRLKLGNRVPLHGYLNDDFCSFLNDSSVINKMMLLDNDRIIGFIGGPPCPDFSAAGKNKGVKGDNGKLTQKYFELIAKEKPDFFVFENVKGLWRTKKHRIFYDKMFKKMNRCGYYVVDKMVNSLEYDVPQDRERVLMVGIRYDNRYQKQNIKQIMDNFRWGVQSERTIKDIIDMNWPDTAPFCENGYLKKPEGIIESLTIQYWFEKNDVDNHVNSGDYFKPRAGLKRMQSIEEGDVSRKSYKRLHRWRYSPTAAYGNNEVHLHPYKIRRLSVAEVMAIQSVPKEFELPIDMSLTDKFKTIGNGVPVLMAEKFGRELKEVLDKLYNDEV